MLLVAGAGISHVAYVLVIYSFALLLFLFTNILINLYASNEPSLALPKDSEQQLRMPRLNGHRPTESAQIRDAEEFELEGLMSDDEPPETPTIHGKRSEHRME